MSKAVVTAVAIGLASVAIIPATARSAAGPQTTAKPSSNAKTPPETMQKVCGSCHSVQIVMDTPKDYDAWHDTVQVMVDRGAKATPEELDLVMQYLFENMTTADVNSADAETLAAVLHAPESAVNKIIARRSVTPFHNLQELIATVPGLNAAALEAKKRMIFFN
jgi:DNA uptake protein ComE-like DNA-binding protein